MTTAIDELSARNAELQKDLAGKDEEISELRRMNNAQRTVVEQEQAKTTAAEAARDQVANQAQELHERDEQRLRTADESMKQSAQQLAEAEGRARRVEERLKTLKDQSGKIKKLKQSNEALKQQASNLRQQLARLRQVDDQKTIADLRDDVKSLKATVGTLQARLRDGGGKVDDLEDTLKRKEGLLEKAKKRVSHLEGLLGDQAAKTADLPKIKQRAKSGLQALSAKSLRKPQKEEIREVLSMVAGL